MFEPSFFSQKNRKVIPYSNVQSIRRAPSGVIRVECEKRTFEFRAFADVENGNCSFSFLFFFFFQKKTPDKCTLILKCCSAFEIIGGVRQRHIRSHTTTTSDGASRTGSSGGVAAVDNLSVMRRVSRFFLYFFFKKKTKFVMLFFFKKKKNIHTKF